MDGLLDVTILFAFVLALSLLIERTLEILKSVYYLLDSRWDWHRFWTKRARKLGKLLEKKMNVFEFADSKGVAAILSRFREMLLDEKSEYAGSVPVVSGDLVRMVSVRSALKVIGVAIGIGLALAYKIDLVEIWKSADTSVPKPEGFTSGMVLSGIAIGLGSGPLNKIIKAIERKRKKRGGTQA
jgi:hypothetical protein